VVGKIPTRDLLARNTKQGAKSIEQRAMLTNNASSNTNMAVMSLSLLLFEK
jgi:hypothetical protein